MEQIRAAEYRARQIAAQQLDKEQRQQQGDPGKASLLQGVRKNLVLFFCSQQGS